MTPTLESIAEQDLKQAIAYADSLDPLFEAILNPKPRFDAAADRREDGMNDARIFRPNRSAHAETRINHALLSLLPIV